MDKIVSEELQNNGLLDYFNSLAPSHQREYLEWVSDAKKDATKTKRLKKMIEMLKTKKA